MEPAPLKRRAIIRIDGKEAELMLGDDFLWACGDAEREDRLNEHRRQICRRYSPDPVIFLVEAAAKRFNGEIVSIPPPRKTQADPNTVSTKVESFRSRRSKL